MIKVYIIYKKDGYMHDTYSEEIGFVESEEDAKAYVDKLNIPHDKEHEEYQKCVECRKYEDDDHYQNNEMFRNALTCEKACLLSDRNGRYCDNDLSDMCRYDNAYYWYKEIERIEG